MPEQYYYTEVQPVRCVAIRVPLVIESVDVEAVLDNVFTVPELVTKVDKIRASVRDFSATPVFVEEDHHGPGPHGRDGCDDDWYFDNDDRFGHDDYHHHNDKEYVMVHHGHHSHRPLFIKKIIVTGVLHKQIFYVNKNNEVKHVGEDLPFSKLVELSRPVRVRNKRDVFVQFRHVDVDTNWEIQRGCRLHQTAVVQATARVSEDRRLFVQTCPSPEMFPLGNLLRDGSVEAWASPYAPVFWGATNVSQTSTAHSGSFAAEIGLLNPELPGAMFQMINKRIVGDHQYRLTFWVREDVLGSNHSAFSLTAEVAFFDQHGTQIGIGTETLSSTGISDNSYTQVQFVTPVTDRGIDSILVRFSFTPSNGNTNSVKIDDVVLECMRRR